MAEPDGVDGRHKAGHDGGGSQSTCIAIRAKNWLDKIRNFGYTCSLERNRFPAGRLAGRGDAKPRLFENVCDQNPLREL